MFGKSRREPSGERRRWAWRVAIPALFAAGIGAALVSTGDAGPLRTVPREASGAVLVSTPVCTGVAFCVTGGTLAAPVYPGGAGQPLPVSFTNPFSVPITVTSLQVSFTNRFPTGCPASAFEVNDVGLAGTTPAVTLSPGFTIGAARKSGPTTSTYAGAILRLADLGDQDACQGIPLSFDYVASATYNSTNCLTGSRSGMTVTSGQVVCIAASGRVTGGITVQTGGVLIINGGTATGGITSSGAAGINLCGARITGGTTVSGSAGEVVLGDGRSCAGSSFTGGLALSSNRGGIQVIGNSVTGGLTLTGNTGSVPLTPATSGQFVYGNAVSGGMACSANSPFSDNGSANSVTGTRSGQCAGAF